MPDLGNLRIDPAMTAYAQELGNGSFAADRIFPEITDSTIGETGKYWIFDSTRDLLRETDDKRAPGAVANRVDYDATTSTYTTEDHALDIYVPQESVDNATAPTNVLQRASQTLDKKLRINREIRAAATLVAGVTNTSDPEHEWNDITNGDIMGDVNTARQAVRDNTSGQEANFCLMDAAVWDAVKLHPQIIDRVKAGGNNQEPAQPFQKAVAMLFEVDEIIVTSAYKNTAIEGQTASTSAVWGDDVYFWWQAASSSLEDASFAYSITWSPTRFMRGFDDDAEAYKFRQGRWYVDKIVLAAAAYRLQNRLT